MKFGVLITLVTSTLLHVGCATKGYVHHQISPLINHVNELDDGAAQNSRDLKAAGNRITHAVIGISTAARITSERVADIALRARSAQDAVFKSSTKIKSLQATLANVNRYRLFAERSVQFQFDEKTLNLQSREVLDELVANIPQALNYLIVIEGGTDVTGQAEYNVVLSQKRAQAVARYLAIKHNISLYRMRWVGVGMNKPVAPNGTAVGRAQNRRANVTLLIRCDFPESQDQESDADDDRSWAITRPEKTSPATLANFAH